MSGITVRCQRCGTGVHHDPLSSNRPTCPKCGTTIGPVVSSAKRARKLPPMSKLATMHVECSHPDCKRLVMLRARVTSKPEVIGESTIEEVEAILKRDVATWKATESMKDHRCAKHPNKEANGATK